VTATKYDAYTNTYSQQVGQQTTGKTTTHLSAKVKEIMFEISQSSLQGGHRLSVLAEIIGNCQLLVLLTADKRRCLNHRIPAPRLI